MRNRIIAQVLSTFAASKVFSMKGNKGIFLLVFAALFFTSMSSLVRTLPALGGLHTVYFRFLFCVAILAILALTKVLPLTFNNRKLLILRGLTGGVATFLFYLSIQKLGVGKGTVMTYSYPIFASIMSSFFLKEKISVRKWMVILVSFGGLILLSLGSKSDLSAISKYEILAFVGALLSASSIVFVKKLHETDNSQSIFFSQAIMGFWIFAAPANLQPIDLSAIQLLTLFGIGITAVGAQLFMTEAYKHVNVSTGASFLMSVPVSNLVIGGLFFHETLNHWEIVGSCIVIGACFMISRFKNL